MSAFVSVIQRLSAVFSAIGKLRSRAVEIVAKSNVKHIKLEIMTTRKSLVSEERHLTPDAARTQNLVRTEAFLGPLDLHHIKHWC
jgi:hypothetical protein